MFRVIAAALVAVFLCLPATACVPMDPLIQSYQNAGAHVVVVDKRSLAPFLAGLSTMTGADYSKATAAFVVETSVGIEVGVEVDGCLLPPVALFIDTTPGNGA